MSDFRLIGTKVDNQLGAGKKHSEILEKRLRKCRNIIQKNYWLNKMIIQKLNQCAKHSALHLDW